MGSNSNINSYDSFRLVEKIIERDFKAGKLTRERAYQVLKDARKNYKSNSTNKQIDVMNKKER